MGVKVDVVVFEKAAEMIAEGDVNFSCNALFRAGANQEIVNAYSKLMHGKEDSNCWLNDYSMEVPEGMVIDEWFKDLRVLMLLFAGQYFLDGECI